MGLLGRLVSEFGARLTAGRTTTPDEVRRVLNNGEFDEAVKAVELLPAGLADRDFFTKVLRGEIAYRKHQDTEAEEWFRASLRLKPGAPEAHYGLSTVLLERGDAELALRHAQFAARGSNAARMHAQLGLCYLELGNVDAALQPLKLAARLDDRDASSWCNLGICHYLLGSPAQAEDCFGRALEIRPGHSKSLENLALMADAHARQPVAPAPAGEALKSMNKINAEIDEVEALALQAPDDADTALRLAALYEDAGDASSAIEVLVAFLARHPDNTRVAGELGKVYVDVREYAQAEPHVAAALEGYPDDPQLLRARAEILIQQNKMIAAVPVLERACEIDPTINARGRLAAALGNACRYEEALEVAEGIRREGLWSASLVTVMVDALSGLGRFDEALHVLDQALRDRPFAPPFRVLRGVILLLQEKFGPGWDDYFYRNLANSEHLRVMPFPLWKGEPLEGKTIVVAAEQGLGDQVMFASCLPDLLALRPARVIVECINRVAPTVARSFPQCEVIATRQDRHMAWLTEVGHVDYFTLIGDLPMQFRRERKDFPRHEGYLVPDPGRKAYWAAELVRVGGRRPRIGLSWRGGTEQTRATLRTARVEDFAELARGIDVTWVCLQYGDVSADLDTARADGLDMSYWPGAINDLDDFAALISNVDLVLTVCNTTVHYAGALNVPVWVVSPKYPEWRYGASQELLPWYPSSRIYRQDEAGQWEPVLVRVKQMLRDRFGLSS